MVRSIKKENAMHQPDTRAPQVTIGVLAGFDDNSRPLVAFADNPQSSAIPASYTFPLSQEDTGCNVALLFADNDVSQPIIVGPIKESIQNTQSNKNTHEVFIDDHEGLILNAKHRITLKCGEASLTLTEDGKILLRGHYISSSATGMQTIKGGSVQIN
jgi:hypothetical protein